MLKTNFFPDSGTDTPTAGMVNFDDIERPFSSSGGAMESIDNVPKTSYDFTEDIDDVPSNTFDAIPTDVFDAIPSAVSEREERRHKRLQQEFKVS